MNNDLISRSALLDAMKTEEWAVILGNSFVRYLKAKTLIEKIPAVDAEKVFEQMGLVKEAFEMAKADLQPVVRCKDCTFCKPSAAPGRFFCDWCRDYFETFPDDFCSHGERRDDNAD